MKQSKPAYLSRSARYLALAACLVFTATFVSAAPPPGTVLLDTIDLSPNADAYLPQRMALNHTTHKLYVAGAVAVSFQNHGVKVIDTSSGAVINGIDLGRYAIGSDRPRAEVDLIAVDESAGAGGNRVYTVGFSGFSNQTIRTVMRIIDGQSDTLLNGEGNDLFLPIGPPEAMVVNPVSHEVYVLDSNGNVEVINGPTGSVITHFDAGVGFSPHVLVANPVSNKIFAFGRSGGAIIDGTSEGVSPITVPPGFNAVTGVCNPANGRIYVFGSDSNGNSGIYVFDGSSGAVLLSKTSGVSADVRGLTIDAASNTLYAGAPTLFASNGPVAAFNATDLTAKGTFNVGAAALEFDSVNGGRLFLLDYDFSRVYPSLRNSVGILNPATGILAKTTVGYLPNQLAINAQTNRIYIADEQAAELVVLNGADHSVLARVPVSPATSDPHYSQVSVIRYVAVSETLNRVYLTRTAQTSDDGTKTAFVDVFDGSNNQLLQSVPLSSNFLASVGFVAVDDNRHRVYVTGTTFSGSSYDAALFVLNADTNALITSFPTVQSLTGLGVNPVTGRIYVASNNNGGHVQIIDGADFHTVATVNAGALPGPMAVNRTTNKVYVANTGAGSVDNSVTVINGATDSVETTFSNTNANNGDAVTSVAVDEATNKIYVGDNSDQLDITGRITVFSGANNSFLGQVEVGRYPTAVAFNGTTRELFVTNNEDGTVSVLGSGVPPPPPAPPHGGLSATVFKVNGSKLPANNLADTALHFSAQQSGTPGGLIVRVQFNTTPNNNAIDWINLNNGSKGYMTFDKASEQFVLGSTNYPTANGLYFRALSTAPGYPDSASNVVGPFNLPAGQNHLGSTTLYVATNGPGAEMKFRANVAVDQAAITLFIQATTSPDDDASWVGLNDGRSGQMHPYADPKRFYLDTTKYPPGDVVYFRAVATAVGFVQSISNIIGVTKVIVGTPPTVEVLPPFPQPGSQSGLDTDHPLIAAMGTLNMGATASSSEGKTIKKLGLIYDGATIDVRENGAGNMTTQYTTNVPGDHVIKAFAVDERGIVGYADPVYIRIKPVGGKVFNLIASGDWSNPANWRDANGNPGVPGFNDFAIVGALEASIAQNVSAFAVSLNGGSINGAGGLFSIDKFLSIAAGQMKNINLTVNSGAIMALVGDSNVPMSGSVTNNGTIKLTGRGGIVPVPSGAKSMSGTDGLFDGIAAFFKNAGDFIFHRHSTPTQETPPPSTPPAVPAPHGVLAAKFENAGRLITNDGGSLITQDGGSLITQDGGSLIGNDGAGLITNDGGSVISNDGASLIGNDGASLITQDGGSRPALPSFGVEAAAVVPGFVQTGGETNLSHIQVVSSVQLDGGTLSGSGIIVGSLTNNSGFISPGHSAGTIVVTGDFTQATQGTLIVENGGAIGGQSDLLQITGAASLGGKLDIRAINGYKPDPADTFSPLSYSSVSGSFSSVSSNAQLTFNANGALATNNVSAPQPTTGQPLNIATRMSVQTDDNVLIAGFIVTGPSGSTKKVLIRGMGPSLAQFGVPGTLSDPYLELHKPDGSVVSNDNWQEGDTSQIPDGFAPGDPRESVIVATLTPGNYSAVLKDAHGETGIGIAEVYDLDSASPAKLANISTRGFINTDDNVMIGGFIIGGNEPAKILVRAIGPTLTDFGVPGALDDPMLELHDSNGSTISNDDWRETQESEITATTIPPNKDREPAILATLVPGNYTAIVRGKNNTTGIGLVEAYNLQ